MHTHRCVLIEISMEIGMLNFWFGLLVTALMKETYFSISSFSTHLVMMYSKVVKAGINSAGWFASEMAAYCGGNVFRLKQKLQTHNFALKSTWHIGFKIALQLALAQRTGSYWIGGRSGLSLRGVYKTPKGTTIRVASSLDDGQTFQDNRMPSRSSFCCIYSW